MLLIGVAFGYISEEHPGPRPDAAFRVLLGVFPVLCLVVAHRFFMAITPRPVP